MEHNTLLLQERLQFGNGKCLRVYFLPAAQRGCGTGSLAGNCRAGNDPGGLPGVICGADAAARSEQICTGGTVQGFVGDLPNHARKTRHSPQWR